MGHDFMDGVWERVKRLEQAEALLAAKPPRRPAVAVAAAAAVLLLAAFTPSLAARYQEWLSGPQTAYLDQDETALDQGIEIHTLAGFNGVSTVELLFTVRDVEADRLGGGWLRLDLEWEQEPAGAGWGSTQVYGVRFLEYDAKERSWLLSTEFDLSETADFEGLFLHITQIEPVWEAGTVAYPLDGLPIGQWIAAPGEGLPDGLGIEIYSCAYTEEGLELTASIPEGGVDLQLVDWQGQSFTMTRTKADGMQFITFPGVTETSRGLELQLEYSYVPEAIKGDWRLPVRTRPVEERIVRLEGQAVGSVPLKEAALSNTMVRITVEAAEEEAAEALDERLAMADLLLHLKDGGVCSASYYSGIEWEADDDGRWQMYKWMLPERVDPDMVAAIEISGAVIPLD